MFRRSVEFVIAVFPAISVVLICIMPIQAQQTEGKAQSTETVTVSAQTMDRLQQHLADLEVEVQELKAQMKDMQSTTAASRPAADSSSADSAHSTAG